MDATFAVLALEDGNMFIGKPFGALADSEGEVVFNTAMTGYQEIITDPSYAGQMVCMTYPLIGNYGVNAEDAESFRPWVRALIVRELSDVVSNFRAKKSLSAYLEEYGIPGISGVDTRKLTRHIVKNGARRALLTHMDHIPDDTEKRALCQRAAKVVPLEDQDLVAECSTKHLYEWQDALPGIYEKSSFLRVNGDKTVLVIDYGVKRNILRSLKSRGYRVLVAPHDIDLETIQNLNPDGIVLSNGPGDPARLDYACELCRKLVGRYPLLGICLGHQIIARSIGADTARLPYGHHGANHPVIDIDTGKVHITSQNHEFHVVPDTIPDASGFYVNQINLNDSSVEGIAHKSLPVLGVQYHPEGCPGPQDNQYIFDLFTQIVKERKRMYAGVGIPSSSTLPSSVLVIGSGPIVIGQAAEFDYSGTQACKALKEEGIRTILVNSNPATIMTDTEIADVVYVEPLTPEVLEAIIAKERPEALLPTLGGQTGLNLATELGRRGILEKYGVKVLGANLESIAKAEDREKFKQLLVEIGEPVLDSYVCTSVDQALKAASLLGYPVVVRPAYTLGGTGGGIAYTSEDLTAIVTRGLINSAINQVLVEKSLIGWKEIEYEVMRDANDTCITICNMENIDPMGIHTGDSMVVAPSQTLSDKEYQMLRTSALKIIRALGLEGGCNIQFALDPNSFTYYVIEVNPRVSRSSALASKATGYPIARTAAKVAVGRYLHEVINPITGRTYAAFEPSIDYVVTKVPRWPFDKFASADRTLGTQMKSTGEVMAIERTMEASINKAIRSLDQRFDWKSADQRLETMLKVPNDQRLFVILDALREGYDISYVHELTSIDKWFLVKLKNIVDMECYLKKTGLDLDMHLLRDALKMGFNLEMISKLTGLKLEHLRYQVAMFSLWPTFKYVDTCAAEFDARTPYFYSCYEEEDEIKHGAGHDGVIVIGSGPIRIGQGIEFDYCSVHAAWALDEAGRSSIIVNCNPETVSTDFDTADVLYFDPIDADVVEAISRKHSAPSVLVQFGGQTAINLAHALDARGLDLVGTSSKSIDLAEDRQLFLDLLEQLNIPHPPGGSAKTLDHAKRLCEDIGYPVLVRPSYVLGGRAMEIVYDDQQLEVHFRLAAKLGLRGSVLIDKYLAGDEIEVDAIYDGFDVFIPGIMKHIERAGVHSGDSFAVYPAADLDPWVRELVYEYTRDIARKIGAKGLINIQFVLYRGKLHVLEVNPRASRTVPFLSKATGVPMVNIATKVVLGVRLPELGYSYGIYPERRIVAVKAPVFSMAKLLMVDAYVGPEMKSTGEVMGVGDSLEEALAKAFLAAGISLKANGAALVTVADPDKPQCLQIVSKLSELGYTIFATEGTAMLLRQAGFSPKVVHKIGDGKPDVLDVIRSGQVSLVLNTISSYSVNGDANQPRIQRDGFEIRRASVERNIPCITSLDTAQALVDSMNMIASRDSLTVRPLGSWL
jgi:carbamoyl-phosphate synthase large subunit